MPKLREPVDLGFRVPAKLADQIRAQAAQEVRSTSNLVRAICQAHFDRRASLLLTAPGKSAGKKGGQLELAL
jgi:hypothetical protein